jgi:hypothetical protein
MKENPIKGIMTRLLLRSMALLVLPTSAIAQGPFTFSATGSLGTGREFHTATLLPSGKVLVARGNNEVSGNLTSAELYDPASGSWSVTGDFGTGRGLSIIARACRSPGDICRAAPVAKMTRKPNEL